MNRVCSDFFQTFCQQPVVELDVQPMDLREDEEEQESSTSSSHDLVSRFFEGSISQSVKVRFFFEKNSQRWLSFLFFLGCRVGWVSHFQID